MQLEQLLTIAEIRTITVIRRCKMKDRVKVKAVPCEVYSRVVGYFRPVSNWNNGKRQEFQERKHITMGGMRRACGC